MPLGHRADHTQGEERERGGQWQPVMSTPLSRVRCRSMGYAHRVGANHLARGPMIASLVVCALSGMPRVTASAEPSTTVAIEQFSVGSGIEVRGYDDPP